MFHLHEYKVRMEGDIFFPFQTEALQALLLRHDLLVLSVDGREPLSFDW